MHTYLKQRIEELEEKVVEIDCTICHETIKEGKALVCEHLFCYDCIENWKKY